MELIKQIHIICAVATGISFFVRGVWLFHDSPLFHARLTKVLPHAIDTLLLVTGIVMAWQWHLNPVYQPWLIGKLIALLLYIGLGMLAFRFVKQRERRFVCWLLALVVLLHMYGFALSKSLLYLPSI